MEVNVNGNVTLTIQPSDSLIALFGGLMGSGAALPKPTETAKPLTTTKKNAVKIEEKPSETPAPVEIAPQDISAAVSTETLPVDNAVAAPDENVKKYTLEEVKAIVTAYLGSNDGTPAFTGRRENILALNKEFGGAMTTIFDKLTPVKIAEYVDRVKALS